MGWFASAERQDFPQICLRRKSPWGFLIVQRFLLAVGWFASLAAWLVALRLGVWRPQVLALLVEERFVALSLPQPAREWFQFRYLWHELPRLLKLRVQLALHLFSWAFQILF